MKHGAVRQTFLALAGLGAAGLCAGALVAGCGGGGGGGGGGVATAPIASANDAALFLQQATFGPSPSDIEHLQAVGYEYWLEEQFAQPRTEHLVLVDGFRAGTAPDPATRMNAWWLAAMRGSDQLRQRMGYALSQILVVSDLELSGNDNVRAMAAYQDTLCQNAFANYKDLLKNVSLSPVMDQYLNSVRNEKADPARNIRPDENYARELMQLFSIGLVQLNPDGSVRLDGSGNPIPTYNQEVIEGFAAVFTGFTYPGTTNWRNPPKNLFDPMIAFEDFHDTNVKTILDGQTLPAGRTAAEDLDAAIEAIFRHPNVPPFISKQLIQRFTTSNPTPAYVARVSAVFNNDGNGIRGNLRAVLRAILLDDEARRGRSVVGPNFGKIKEPLIKQTSLWRAFGAFAADGLYQYNNPENEFAQAALRSPTVFNFYRPDYTTPGELATGGLVAPELQIVTDTTITNTTNRWFFSVYDRYSGRPNIPLDGVILVIDAERQITDIVALVDRLNTLLMAGSMSAAMRQVLTDHLATVPLGVDNTDRILEAIYLIVSSPEYQVAR